MPMCDHTFEDVPKNINITFDIITIGVRIKKEINGFSFE